MTNSEGNILWRHTAKSASQGRVLDDNVSADVVIIGAGFTGLSAALHLVQAGAKVCVLEANAIGHGGSGRNVGLVNAGLWTPPDTVEKILGKTAGVRLNAMLAAAPQVVFDLVDQHGIACAATRNGTLHCAADSAGVDDLKLRHDQQIQRQAPVQLLSAQETARRVGSQRFRAALYDRRAGTVQPLAYAHGLASAAVKAGADLYEGSPAVAMARTGSTWKVDGLSGSVTATHLILATNAYNTIERSRKGFTLVRFFQCATTPLPPEFRQKFLPGGEGCWDTAKVMSSFRMDAAGRLIVGGVGNLDGAGGTVHRAWAMRTVRWLYPELPPLDIEYGWTGCIAMTDDHLPKVVEIGENAVSIFGYSGRGIGPGTVFGQCAAKWMTEADRDAFPVPVLPRYTSKRSTMKALYFEAGSMVYHLVDRRFC